MAGRTRSPAPRHPGRSVVRCQEVRIGALAKRRHRPARRDGHHRCARGDRGRGSRATADESKGGLSRPAWPIRSSRSGATDEDRRQYAWLTGPIDRQAAVPPSSASPGEAFDQGARPAPSLAPLSGDSAGVQMATGPRLPAGRRSTFRLRVLLPPAKPVRRPAGSLTDGQRNRRWATSGARRSPTARLGR